MGRQTNHSRSDSQSSSLLFDSFNHFINQFIDILLYGVGSLNPVFNAAGQKLCDLGGSAYIRVNAKEGIDTR